MSTLDELEAGYQSATASGSPLDALEASYQQSIPKPVDTSLYGIGKDYINSAVNAVKHPIDTLSGAAETLYGGAKNIFNIPNDPTTGLSTITKGALTTAGGGAGAAVGGSLGLLGGPLAPVTVPLGALIGSGIGGALGYQGGDIMAKTAESVGENPASPSMWYDAKDPEILNKVAQMAGTSLPLGAAGEIAALPLRGTSKVAGAVEAGAENSLLGYNPANKSKLIGGLDAEGNFTKNAADMVSQVSKRDLKVQDLKESGFWDRISAKDGAKDVAIKLSQFKQENGAKIGSVIDEASKAENSIINNRGIPASEKAKIANSKTSPDFSEAQNLIEEIKITDESAATTLQKRLDAVKKAWDDSPQDLGSLKTIQESQGLTGQKTYNPAKTSDDILKDDLNNHLYGALAGSLKGRVAAIGQAIGKPELATQFADANKAYSAATTFENSAFNASRKGGLMRAVNDVASLKSLPAYALSSIPVIGPLLASERAVSVLKDIAPVQVAKGAGAIKSATKATANAVSDPLTAAMVAIASKAKKEPEQAPAQSLPAAVDSLKGSKKADPVESILDAIKHVESRGNPNAVSSKGAEGAYQIMPDMQKRLGVSDPKNEKDARAGAKKLFLQELSFFKDPKLAMAAYNLGRPKLIAAGWKPGKTFEEIAMRLPAETREYVPKVLAQLGQA